MVSYGLGNDIPPELLYNPRKHGTAVRRIQAASGFGPDLPG